tara:strand:- start:40 stop:423 length:384 start_codon:yes stop_codon:yes gene_type:complete
MIYKWLNEEKTLLIEQSDDGTHGRVVEVGMAEFAAMASRDDIVDFSPPPPPPELLECSPAQMRIALHRAGLLAQVQAIADADPEAAIVWEYATTIERNSPFIDALGFGAFTPEQIDDLFRAAMGLKF